MEVMDFRYLTFLYFVTMIAPLAFMAGVYAVIFRVVRKQVGGFLLGILVIVQYSLYTVQCTMFSENNIYESLFCHESRQIK